MIYIAVSCALSFVQVRSTELSENKETFRQLELYYNQYSTEKVNLTLQLNIQKILIWSRFFVEHHHLKDFSVYNILFSHKFEILTSVNTKLNFFLKFEFPHQKVLENCFLESFFFFRAVLVAYGDSQARGQIGAVAAGLGHSHSNARSEVHLQSVPQLIAMLDSQPTERGHGSNLHPHGF